MAKKTNFDDIDALADKAAKKIVESEEESESEDEAPEEESLDQVAETIKTKQAQIDRIEQERREKERQKRKERNEQLQKQTEGRRQRKHEALPLDLLEQAERDRETQESTPSHANSDNDTLIPSLPSISKPKGKKTVFNKGPVKVKVLEKKKKALAPTSNSIISKKRDRFLNRRSVQRR
ncbi:hypothetical protein TRVA0_001S00232 [Trichomonascus vanleenenianus]|uniref:uncharacterized protein n=1 Tax=Trichomonascus vanleenenianus TaxID=2268995 RepID=UPI003EC983B2